MRVDSCAALFDDLDFLLLFVKLSGWPRIMRRAVPQVLVWRRLRLLLLLLLKK